MDKSEIQERVIKVVCQVLNTDKDMVEPSSNFVFDLGAESTQSVQLVAAFEEEFGIEMEGEAALSVQTVGEAADFVAKYVK
ncbi:MAG: acyl carrier protein [Actinobacteria bacterium]|nr:acyl carrier protein [Actinomycetota bacterium]